MARRVANRAQNELVAEYSNPGLPCYIGHWVLNGRSYYIVDLNPSRSYLDRERRCFRELEPAIRWRDQRVQEYRRMYGQHLFPMWDVSVVDNGNRSHYMAVNG